MITPSTRALRRWPGLTTGLARLAKRTSAHRKQHGLRQHQNIRRTADGKRGETAPVRAVKVMMNTLVPYCGL